MWAEDIIGEVFFVRYETMGVRVKGGCVVFISASKASDIYSSQDKTAFQLQLSTGEHISLLLVFWLHLLRFPQDSN